MLAPRIFMTRGSPRDGENDATSTNAPGAARNGDVFDPFSFCGPTVLSGRQRRLFMEWTNENANPHLFPRAVASSWIGALRLLAV